MESAFGRINTNPSSDKRGVADAGLEFGSLGSTSSAFEGRGEDFGDFFGFSDFSFRGDLSPEELVRRQ
jgi:hypothetical protein